MARPVRLDYPGTFYHVLSRGNERRDIFYDKEDYKSFISSLEKMAEKFHIEVHAFVLMSNHYHLIVKTLEPNLSRAVQWLGVCYSTRFNRRHNRSGHLFQGRFKSFIIEDDRYLAALCLYIHRNPMRAGIVDRLSSYPWSSFHAYSGTKGLPWLKTSIVQGVYGGINGFIAAQKEYTKEEENLLAELRYGLFLGREGFAESFKDRLEKEKDMEKPQAKRALKVRDIDDTITAIFLRLGEKKEESLMRPLRRAKRPLRDLAIYMLSRMGIFTHREIGQKFGVGYTCITGVLKRAEEYLQREKVMKEKVEGILIDI